VRGGSEAAFFRLAMAEGEQQPRRAMPLVRRKLGIAAYRERLQA
jgi:hypothetical protein